LRTSRLHRGLVSRDLHDHGDVRLPAQPLVDVEREVGVAVVLEVAVDGDELEVARATGESGRPFSRTLQFLEDPRLTLIRSGPRLLRERQRREQE
jgi:hypothetical protein